MLAGMTTPQPAPITRAKFQLIREERYANTGQVKYFFQARYDDTIPEDVRYAKYTPCGELWINVDNPNVDFGLGVEYYLDFTPVPEPAAATD